MGYFYDRSETVRTGEPSDLPLPDVLACNGKHLYDLLSESGYPGLIETEAVRYMYLDKVLSLPRAPRKGRPVLLVAGTYNRNETRSLVGLVAAAAWNLGREALVDIPTFAIAILSGLLLLRFRLNSAWLVLGGAAIGLVLSH